MAEPGLKPMPSYSRIYNFSPLLKPRNEEYGRGSGGSGVCGWVRYDHAQIGNIEQLR